TRARKGPRIHAALSGPANADRRWRAAYAGRTLRRRRRSGPGDEWQLVLCADADPPVHAARSAGRRYPPRRPALRARLREDPRRRLLRVPRRDAADRFHAIARRPGAADAVRSYVVVRGSGATASHP